MVAGRLQECPSLALMAMGCCVPHIAQSNSCARALKTSALQFILGTPALLRCVCWPALPSSCALCWHAVCPEGL
jgi:hypothetical protein